MRIRPTFALILLAVLLCAAGVLAIGQQSKPPTLATPPTTGSATTVPVILSGSDVGFRVEGYSGGVPVGRVVVQMDGKWVEPLPPPAQARFVR